MLGWSSAIGFAVVVRLSEVTTRSGEGRAG